MCDDPQGSGGWRWVTGTTDAPKPQLTIEANPEVGRMLGPDGKLAKIVRAKPDWPIGFR